MPEQSAPEQQFGFIRDGSTVPVSLDWKQGPDSVRKALGEALSARHVAFLVGAGCSSLWLDDSERGIPTMLPLARTFCAANIAEAAGVAFGSPSGTEQPAADRPSWLLSEEERSYLDQVGIDLGDPEYQRNLERLMEALFSLRFLLSRSSNVAHKNRLPLVESAIEKVKSFLWEQCTGGPFSQNDNSVVNLYEKFYRKLILRDRSLPRPWVFTTNYDLFNERALDRIGIPYANGFSGVIERRFNPSTFRYALAEQMDLTQRKWSAVDGFIYLCKMHGSLSWTEDDHGLFPIREQWPPEDARKVMIYPTPAKQNSSLGSPYSDLFREFQFRIVREQSVLVTVGYAFGDEHINNLIYQALTIPTFRLIIFADPMASGEIGKLRDLGDPRIWIIGGDGPEVGSKAHYFDQIVEHFMPQRPSDRLEEAIGKVLSSLVRKPLPAAPELEDPE